MIAPLTARTRALLFAALAAAALLSGAGLTHAPTTTHAAPGRAAIPASSYWQYTLGHSRQHGLYCTGTRRGGVTTLRCSRWGYPGLAVASTATAASHAAAPVSHARNNTFPWGQCTWLANQLAGNRFNGFGDAWRWLGQARARGLATGTTPRVGATVVFQPHVQGAGSLGHVARVIAVHGSSFDIEEMNSVGWTYHGVRQNGGFGKISYRTAYTGAGVAFIYA